MEDEEKYLGYLKYSGKSVENGLLDARKSGEALLGFDELLRYFIEKEDPELSKIDFEIPVRIRKGSWEAAIPVIIEKLLTLEGVLYTSLVTYSTVTATKAAQDGLFNTGMAKDIKGIVRTSFKAIQWVIKIAKHLGTMTVKEVRAKISKIGPVITIELVNAKGEILIVPKKYYDIFERCPKNIFERTASLIEVDRIMEIGVIEENGKIEKETITNNEKSIYATRSDDDGTLFPELRHGQYVELEGAITRGNEKTNTIGFEYHGHILTSKPIEGHIKDYKKAIVSQEKEHLFPSIRMIGQIDRRDENGGYKEKRPLILFSKIIQIEEEHDKTKQLSIEEN